MHDSFTGQNPQILFWTWSKHPASGMPGDGASDKRAMCAGAFIKDIKLVLNSSV